MVNKMICIANYYELNKRLLFDYDKGEVTSIDCSGQGYRGFYVELEMGVLAFYRLNERLELVYQKEKHLIENGIKPTYERKGKTSLLSLQLTNGEIVKLVSQNENMFIENDFTMTDAEDFDFLLFINNVIKNEDRIKNVFQK